MVGDRLAGDPRVYADDAYKMGPPLNGAYSRYCWANFNFTDNSLTLSLWFNIDTIAPSPLQCYDFRKNNV